MSEEQDDEDLKQLIRKEIRQALRALTHTMRRNSCHRKMRHSLVETYHEIEARNEY